MNCNLTDTQRIDGMRCRSFDCVPCREFHIKFVTKDEDTHTPSEEMVFAPPTDNYEVHGVFTTPNGERVDLVDSRKLDAAQAEIEVLKQELAAKNKIIDKLTKDLVNALQG